MTNWRVAVALVATAVPGSSLADISLSFPIQCNLGQDCFIQQYVDHDASQGAKDYRCSPLSYDGHKGTDFALKTHAEMEKGVNVLASAPGTVRAIRDGEPDRLYGGRFGEVPSNRACGNGVVIDHADGWSTQYCHLREGSVSVRKGQTVQRGAVIGQVGLSGRTQFPHVHITLRQGDRVVDPFDPDGKITCNAPSTETLWQKTPSYQPGGLLDAGFSDRVPEYDAIKAGRATSTAMPKTAPALVLFGYAFGGRKGDLVSLRITGPAGEVVRQDVRLTKNQAQFFRAAGKKRTSAAWPTGRYTGTVDLIRDGRKISSERSQVDIR